MEESGRLRALVAFAPGKVVPGTHWAGNWMEPTAGLEVSGQQSLVLPGISLQFLGRPARKLLTILPELSRLVLNCVLNIMRVLYTVM
jgi:hypothetical protein